MDFGNVVLPWSRHIRAGRDLVRRAFEAANKIGDITYAAYCGNELNTNLLAAGDPLAEVEREAEHGLAFAQKARFGFVIDTIATQLGLIRTLRGLTPTFGSFDDEQFDERRIERHFSENPDLAFVECWYWVRKLQARFFAGDYASAIEASSRAQRLLWTSPSYFEKAEYEFYSALSHAASWDAASADQRQHHVDAVAVHQRQLQLWAANCPENFENRAALIGAEVARIEGRELDAERLYEQAIRSARANGFIHNEALASELAARFYAARDFEKIARVYLQDARYAYLRWGADGKVRQLEEIYPYLREEELAPGPTSTIGTPVEHLDLATVIKVSQAISGEMVLEKMLDTLMRTAIAQAGAERGLLILSRGAEPRIAAEATTSGNTILVELRDAPVTATDVLPESVLHYVLRTRESVILDDAATQPSFAADPYIRQRQAHSILCLPLVNQSKLIGVLYLENNLTPRAFVPARIAVLKLLASQAAISLENTRLYRDLEQREAKIRRLVDSNIIGICIVTRDGDVMEANDAFLKIVGYNREDFVAGRVQWMDLTTPESRDRTAQAMAELKGTGTIQPFEKEYFRKDGSRVPVLVGAAAYDEERYQLVSFVLDLTERKRSEQELRESEERFRTLVQFSFDVYWESDAQHRFIRQEFAESVADAPGPGYELGKTRWEVPYLEPDAEAWRKHRETLDAHLPFRDFELARPAPDGGKRYVSVSGLPAFDETGRFIGYRGVGRHITERKRAEEERRYHMQLLKTVTDNASSMLYIVDAAGLGTFVNPSFERITGYRAEEVIGQVVHDKIHHMKPDGTPYPVHECPLTGAVRQRHVLHGEDLFVRKDGTFFPVGYTASPLFRDGEAVGTLIEVQDLTETKAAEAELRNQAQLLSLAHDAIIVRDPECRITFWNEGAAKTYGWTAEEAIGRVGHELLQTRFPVSRRAVEVALEEHGEWEGELTHITRQGTAIFVTSRQSLQRDEHGAGRAILEINRDITERKQAEEELRASEARFRTFVDHASDTFMLHREDGTILDVNRQACESLGYSRDELIGMAPITFDPDANAAFVQSIKERLEAGEIVTFEARNRRKDGTVLPVEVRVREFSQGSQRLGISLARDITERKRAEAEARESERQYREMQMDLAHANRVATMGRLTASIAHEVNQPIAATMTNAQAALRFLDAPTMDLDEVRQILNDIVKDGNRAGEVIGRIRDLVKKAPPRRDRLEINGAIREVIELTRGETTKNGVSVHTELADCLPLVQGDRVQLQQVILNLIVNAIEAVSGLSEGPRELLISTGKVEPGGVLVTVRDSGPGLAPATLEHLFDSFYTTKPSGLGLGLSICRSIVEAHGGRLWASANVPHGAIFQFTVPTVEGM
jgi:PAS domain S-box-containing protein